MNTNDTPIPSSIPPAETSDLVAGRCAVASGSVSGRFVNPQKMIAQAEDWCEHIEGTEEEDRYYEEHNALALWDEMRRLRSALQSIVRGDYAEGADRAHPAVGLARATLSQNNRSQPHAEDKA